eukprot:TRINITY_DN640_c0_g1_i7.p1 TRINITY_DN640_c0_g1~~TRINITY_DN640_c0_g1_i7.p1  ORF type:complete len:2512 (+),score=542.25 TRINITY_DN640_c0_g1_i7:107-7642(+)
MKKRGRFVACTDWRRNLSLAIVIVLAVIAVKVNENIYGGWNYDSKYPLGMDGHKIASRGEIVYSFGSFFNPEYYSEDPRFDRIWLLNTTSMEWTWKLATGDVPERRWEYCIGRIENQIYLFGGRAYPGGAMVIKGDLHSLNLDVFSWELQRPEGYETPSNREWMACDVFENRFYVYGGFDGNYATDMWYFDIDSKKWSFVKAEPKRFAPTVHYTHMALYQDNVVIFSGLDRSSVIVPKIWSYNITTSQWQRPFEFPDDMEGRFDGAISIYNDNLYAFGGSYDASYKRQTNSIDMFDFRTRKLETVFEEQKYTLPISAPTKRFLAASAVANRKLVVIGGYNQVFSGTYNDVWLFDPETKIWTNSSMNFYPIERRYPAVTKVSDSEIALFGGRVAWDEVFNINDLWLFDTGTKSWRTISREHSCLAEEMNCAPQTLDPAFGFFNKTFYIIGGSVEGFCTFSLDRMTWQSHPLRLNGVGAYRIIYSVKATINHRIIIWGGFVSNTTVENMDVFVFDMESGQENKFENATNVPSHRYLTSALSIGDDFCFVDTNKRIQREVWCWDQGINGWRQVASVPSTFDNAMIVLGFDASLFAFGGNLENGKLSRNIAVLNVETQKSTIISNQERSMPEMEAAGALILDGTAFVFGGWRYENMNTIYSLQLNQLWCRGVQIVDASQRILSDGSEQFRYQPGTQCTWNLVDVSHVVVQSVSLESGATLELSIEDICADELEFQDLHSRQMNLAQMQPGSVIHIPDRASTVQFMVEQKAAPGDGFSLLLFDCNKGFSAREDGCFCASGRFINFAGLCVPCPAGTIQQLENQSFCVAKEEPNRRRSSKQDESSKTMSMDVNNLVNLPSVAYASAALVEGTLYIVGGSQSTDPYNAEKYRHMSTALWMESSVDKVWHQSRISGDIPQKRVHGCFVGVGPKAYLIGGRTSNPDSAVYVLDVSNMFWQKRKSTFEGVGSVCASYGLEVVVYGGQNSKGSVTDQLRAYHTEKDSWRDLRQDGGGFAGVAYAGGGIVGSKMFVFGGFDGMQETNQVRVLDLESETASISPLLLDKCVACVDEGGVCEFGRQLFASAVIGNEMHVYGGVRQAEVLADILVIDLESKLVVHRENYGLSNPALPLRHPGPKQGSLGAYFGGNMIVTAGGDANGLTTNDEWIWSPDMRAWTDSSIVRAPIHRVEASIATLDAKTLVLFGGATNYIEELLLNDLWQYSLEIGRWEPLAAASDTSGPRGRAGAALHVADGSIYVVGGRTAAGEIDEHMWIFSTESKMWRSVPFESLLSVHQRPLQRFGAAWVWTDIGFLVWGGQIPVGTGRTEFYTAAALLDTDKMQLKSHAIRGAVPARRKYHSMCPLDSARVLIHGGLDHAGNLLADTWTYDTASQEWRQLLNAGTDSFGGLASSTCATLNTSTVLFGTDPQTGQMSAWMIQHDFNVRARLLLDNHGSNPALGLELQAGLFVGSTFVSFGGRSKDHVSNVVYAYQPGFCQMGVASEVHSGFLASTFDDGSGEAMYLKTTDCKWHLPNATDIVVQKKMRTSDSLRIITSTDGKAASPLDTRKLSDGSEVMVFTGSGFVVEMSAQNHESEAPEGCSGCYGFTITHAACGPNSSFDVQTLQCKCTDGHRLNEAVCEPEPALEDQSSNSPVLVPVVSGVAVAFVLLGVVGAYVYRRRMLSNIQNVEAKLFGVIHSHELKFGPLLGEGGFGQVYKGEWRGSDVAIKRLIEKDITAAALAAFKREIALIVELRHPNIVLYMGACLEKGFVCLVSELMEHGSLFDVLHDSKKVIPLQLRIRFMLDIVKGMKYLHSSNPPILHRDLKSLNILADDQFRLKVSDFGLTTLQGSDDSSNAINGSLLWLAPEVLLGNTYTAESDVYSFGIIAWEIMTQCEPFDDSSTPSLPYLISTEHLRPKLPENLPPEIEDIITSSWDPTPKLRPSFIDLHKKLSELAQPSKSSYMDSFMDLAPSEKPPSGTVYIVCIRVAGAEALWEDIPLAMGDATLALSEVVIKTSASQKGYISQNDGESFVIIFNTALEAIRFCIESQVSLQSVAWSPQILSHDCSKPLHQDTLKGLRVQMGIHHGDCESKSVPNSNRTRFVGKEVSLAMKLCRAAQGGQVLISEAAYVSTERFRDLVESVATIRSVTGRSGKSTSATHIYEVFNADLHNRADIMQDAARHMPSILISPVASMMASTSSPGTLAESSLSLSFNSSTKQHVGANTGGAATRILNTDSHEDKPTENLRTKLQWEVSSKDIVEGIDSLGRGSFGTVSVGTYKGQKVAIKKMLMRDFNHRVYLMFVTEVSVVRKLSHPNIVAFVGACMDTSNFAILMELVEPGSLASVLQDSTQTITHTQKWKVIRGIIDGMAYLHSMNPPLLHRDLKSANILITHSFDAKICDFGFARMKNTTRTMTKCGTLAYQAPEILRGQRYDEKADVYSFGILAWEIEEREPPYEDEDPAALSFSVPKGKRPLVAVLKDRELVSLMQRCWAQDPQTRPSFAELQRGKDVEEIDITAHT